MRCIIVESWSRGCRRWEGLGKGRSQRDDIRLENGNGWDGRGRRIADYGSFWGRLGSEGDDDSLLFLVSHCASGGCVRRGSGNEEVFSGLTSGVWDVKWRHGREAFVDVGWFR